MDTHNTPISIQLPLPLNFTESPDSFSEDYKEPRDGELSAEKEDRISEK